VRISVLFIVVIGLSGLAPSDPGLDGEIAASRTFVRRAGLPLNEEPGELWERLAASQDWFVQFTDYWLGGTYSHGEPRVASFANIARQDARRRLQGEQRGGTYLDKVGAQARLETLHRSLFPDRRQAIASFEYEAEGSVSAGRFLGSDDRCGAARARWSDYEPEGPVFNLENSVTLVIDILDGTLLRAEVSYPNHEVTSRSSTVTEQEARAKARATALAIHGVDMGAHETTATKGFAGVTKLPGVERQRRAAAPYELRFAWRVRALSVTDGAHVQDLFVDIDAQTGEVLNLGWLKPLRPPGQ
jgi:hypothetical protein